MFEIKNRQFYGGQGFLSQSFLDRRDEFCLIGVEMNRSDCLITNQPNLSWLRQTMQATPLLLLFELPVLSVRF